MHALIAVNDMKWAAELSTALSPLECESTKSNSATETIGILKTEAVDLLICETMLKQDDMVSLLQSLPDLQCSIIFITDLPTESIYRRATSIRQARFLVKPFHPLTLRSVVDSLHANRPVTPAPREIRVRGATGQRLAISFDKVLWIRADKNHCFIHTRQNHYVLKQSLNRLSQQLDDRFIRAHRGFWVNIDHVTRISLGRQQIYINDMAIPIGRTYRDQLTERLLDNPNIKL